MDAKISAQILRAFFSKLGWFPRAREILSLPRFGHLPANENGCWKKSAPPSGTLLDFLLQDCHSLLVRSHRSTVGKSTGRKWSKMVVSTILVKIALFLAFLEKARKTTQKTKGKTLKKTRKFLVTKKKKGISKNQGKEDQGFGQNSLIPNWILVFARPRRDQNGPHFGPFWPTDVYFFGPFRPANRTLATPEFNLSSEI